MVFWLTQQGWNTFHTHRKTGSTVPRLNEVGDGGHAVAIVAFDADKQEYYIKNAWGTGEGDEPDFNISYVRVPTGFSPFCKFLHPGFDENKLTNQDRENYRRYMYKFGREEALLIQTELLLIENRVRQNHNR